MDPGCSVMAIAAPQEETFDTVKLEALPVWSLTNMCMTGCSKRDVLRLARRRCTRCQCTRLGLLIIILQCLIPGAVATTSWSHAAPGAYITCSKRALCRAHARAVKHGLTHYKGRAYTPVHVCRRSRGAPAARGQGGGVQHVARLRVLSFNAGAMSVLMWQELRDYLGRGEGLPDVICIQETHWNTSPTFNTLGWHAIHTGTQARAEGVLTPVNPRYGRDQIRYEAVVPGRVQHGRVEVVNVYQHPHSLTGRPDQLRDKRQHLLDRLGKCVAGISLRSTLLLAGNFQTELKPQVPHCGRSVMMRWTLELSIASPKHMALLPSTPGGGQLNRHNTTTPLRASLALVKSSFSSHVCITWMLGPDVLG